MTVDKTILIVDDDPWVRKLMRTTLEGAGYHCYEAGAVAGARHLVEETRIDLLLCDLHLAGESGMDLVVDLAEMEPEVPFVMVSGEDDPEIASLAIERGAFGYLVKPVARGQLLIAIANAFHRHRLEHENAEYRSHLERLVHRRTGELSGMTEELRRSRQEVVDRLSLAVALRDAGTGEHIGRIGRITALLAAQLGMSQQEVDLLQTASPMHDVGKIGIADSILQKPGPLDVDERVEMQRHTEIGYELLESSDSDLLKKAATIALTHHEWYDGSGYPNGLVGDDIPMEGRIVAVADVFDALLSTRPYREAMPAGEVLEAIRMERGTHFDPRVVRALFDTSDEALGLAEPVLH
ncbi:MAG: cyclic di-GMP phosphodiesterase [Solirubrobacterales bacterium]|nr:cyclic di-GMP phosphodiesterase [Solirubrobacterales bacterium]